MARCWPSLILLIYAYASLGNSASFNLTSEITNFIPSCARECFISFLDTNFPSICSKTPTLACLCSHNSTSGYTIGEGAVQCIVSEINIGFCQGNSAKDSVVTDAFGMCGNQPSALPNTHGTITATLVLQTTMPSIVLVAPPATLTPKSLSSSSSLMLGTSSFTRVTTSSPQSTTLPSTSSAAASTNSAVAAADTSNPTATLSKPQIVGITVASIGGAAVVIGIIIIFACCRRKRQKRARESDLLPFQLDPPSHLMSSAKYNYSFKGPTERKPGGTANGVAAKVRPQIPPRIDTSSPNMFSRRSIRPDTIGIAISPENNPSAEKQQRRSSRLLPEKPTLKLQMPPTQTGGISFSQPLHPSIVSRQSTATQFEEDYDDSADTAVNADDPWGRKSTDNILEKTAAAGNWQTVRPVYPDGAAGAGDYAWRPGQANFTPAQPDLYVRPLSIGRKIGSFSQPRRPDVPPIPQDTLTVPTHAARPITATSSIYSARGSVPSNEDRDSVPRVRKNYKQAGPYDFDSQKSALSPVEPRTAGTELSPVVESPASGKSPVSYPKIPGRLSASTIRMVPPPPQPDFTKNLGQQPWRAAEIAAQRERERQAGLQRGLSQRTQQQQRPREPTNFNFPTPPVVSQAGYTSSQPPNLQAPPRAQTRTAPPLQIPKLQPAIQLQPPPRSQTRTAPLTSPTGGWGHKSRAQNESTSSIPLSISTSIPLNPLSAHPSITYTRSSSSLSQNSQLSTSSSLLAKRRGESKAQALVLKDNKAGGGKWRVLKREEIEVAKSEGWRPMVGREEEKGERRPENGREFERMELPTTPSWIPRLTPTRRGDELFLSVQ